MRWGSFIQFSITYESIFPSEFGGSAGTNGLHIHGSISGLFIMLHWCLPLQHPGYCGFIKSATGSPPAYILFLKIVLGILAPIFFKDILKSTYMKNIYWNIIWDYLRFIAQFG